VDADGQHLPKDVKKVAEALLEHPDALVLGTRDFTNTGIPWRSKFGNNLTARLFTSLSGTALQDTQTGLRGFGRSYLSKLILLPTSKYEFELDGLLLAVRDQMTIHQVNIETVYEPGNPTSHFNPLIDSMRIYWVLVRFCFGGISAYLTDLFFFTLLSSLGTSLFGALVVGRLAGAGAGFMASKHIVFKDKNQKNRLLNYAALWIALFVASYFVLDLLTKHLGLNIFMSRIIVDGSLFSLSFYIQKNFVFSSK
jgi:putative flippase GtrA